MKEQIRDILLKSGAIAVGFAKAGEIDAIVHSEYEGWIGEGHHGEMRYLERHLQLRKTTENVLGGAKTVISLAFSYNPAIWREANLPYISSYAYREDYHILLREKLNPVVEEFKNKFGGEWRICIDSAPIAERFWAMKSGIGRRGLNGAIIIEGHGSLCFLVEILTTLVLAPDKPSDAICDKCGRCIHECPTKALRGDGTMDSRRCINYLTIEKKGEFALEEKKLVSEGEGYLFGCDRCLRLCPHNRDNLSLNSSPEKTDTDILTLKPEDILSMDKGLFKRKFLRTPLFYAGFDKLSRNALAILKAQS